MRRANWIITLVIALLPWVACASLARASEQEVTLPGAGITLAGLLFRPAGADQAGPAIIVLHGWAPSGTPGAPRVAPTARALSEKGYVALALSMRGWPKTGGTDDCGSRQSEDVAKAVGWLASQPGVDSDRIGLLGFSQGGQVALLTGAQTKKVKAIVAYYPVTDIDSWKSTTSHTDIARYYIPRVCERSGSRWVSPINMADKIEAPVLLVHGDRDKRVPTQQSLKMKEALQNANRTVELYLVAGADHEFNSQQRAEAWPVALKFFAAYLEARVPSVPLPPDVQVVQPHAEVPKEFAAFSGKWQGIWDAILDHVLVVEEVSSNEARVIYAYGDAPAWKVTRGSTRVKGTFDGNTLVIRLPRPAKVIYQMRPDGKLDAKYEWSGGTSQAVMTKVVETK